MSIRPPATALAASIALLAVTAFSRSRPLALAAPPATAADGITFTYRVQSTASARAHGEERGAPSPNMVATVRMNATNARLDFREGGMPMTQNGGYIVIRGAEQQLVFVNTKDRQAMIIGADGLGSGFGSLTNNAMLKMTVRDPKFSFEELGPGERILGYATRRVRLHTGSTMEMRMLGRTTRTSDSSVSEQWIASRPAGIDPGAMAAWSKSFGMGLQRTNPEMAQMMTDYRRKYGDGFALRTVSYVANTDDRGRVRNDTIRMEVVELTRGAIDPSLFDVPAGYQTVDMRQLAAGMTSAIDSARRANGDTGSLGDAMKKGAADGAAQSAADKAKSALGGLFGRRRP